MSFLHNDSGEGEDWLKTSAATYWFGYNKLANPQPWIEASPLLYASKNSPATLFINSGVERMRAGREDYLKILNDHSIVNSTLTFAEAPHSFVYFEPWYTPMKNKILQFINNKR
ncbi:MAG TPA: hypothetical protein PKD85_24045 [Saprospiraceae bacterium]|nr:hypothetical protein [Saprospiraceae bacterium]